MKLQAAKGTERAVHQQVVNYLKWQFKDVLFKTDYGAGTRLTISQAVQQKKMQALKGWPDIFLAEPRKGFSGLFLEIKREGERIWKRDGKPNGAHLISQAQCMKKLEAKGYRCEFAVGFDEAKRIIDEYLKNK